MVPLEEQVEGGNRGSTVLHREVDMGIYVTRVQASALQNFPERVFTRRTMQRALCRHYTGANKTQTLHKPYLPTWSTRILTLPSSAVTPCLRQGTCYRYQRPRSSFGYCSPPARGMQSRGEITYQASAGASSYRSPARYLLYPQITLLSYFCPPQAAATNTDRPGCSIISHKLINV